MSKEATYCAHCGCVTRDIGTVEYDHRPECLPSKRPREHAMFNALHNSMMHADSNGNLSSRFSSMICDAMKPFADECLVPSSDFYIKNGESMMPYEVLDHGCFVIEVSGEFIKAVAHIGVDFGYGSYQLESKYIDIAREKFTDLIDK